MNIGYLLGILIFYCIFYLGYADDRKRDPKFFKKINRLGWLFFIGLAAAIYYYDYSSPDPYGMNYNAERINRSVYTIPDGWVENTSGNKTKLWYPKSKKKITKGRIGKEVILDRDGKLKIERDAIANLEGEVQEYIKVEYYFEDGKFKYTHEKIRDSKIVKQTEIDQTTYERLLAEWGLENNVNNKTGE